MAFVSYNRWNESGVPDSNAWNVIPNVAAEFVSRTNYADEIESRRLEFLEAGVDLVWIVYTRAMTIHVSSSPNRIDVLAADDELDGGVVISGFRLRVADLFAEAQPPETAG